MILAGVPVPTVTPTVVPSVDPTPVANPYWSGFAAGCWVTAGILTVLIIAFLIGRYWEPPARKKK